MRSCECSAREIVCLAALAMVLAMVLASGVSAVAELQS